MLSRNFKIGEWVVVFVCALILCGAYAYSADVPHLTRYVNDYANILPKNYADSLNERLAQFQKTHAGEPQVVVVTVPNTGDDSIEEFTNKTFHDNKIGHTNNNNGVLTVVSMDHKMRIEVGYDLEPKLTDAKSADILNIMKPSMKAGNYPKAFDDEMAQLLPIVNSGSAEVASAAPTQPQAKGSSHIMAFLLFLIFIGVVFYFVRKVIESTPIPGNPPVTRNPYIPPTYDSTQDHPNRTYYAPPRPSYVPPTNTYSPNYETTTPSVVNTTSRSGNLESAALGGLAGFAAAKVLDSSNDDSSRRSSSWDNDSYTDNSSSSSDNNSSSFGGDGGDSGGAGASSDW